MVTGRSPVRARREGVLSGVRRCSIGTKYAQVLGLARRAKRIQTVTDFINEDEEGTDDH
jgi:hypothetical protein